MNYYPEKIICLTEESVEFLFDLGKSNLIVGVSVYVERPAAAKALPKIGAFTHANSRKILDLKPDLIIGFSDIQKDIARDLIEMGQNVFISNQRSLFEIFQYLFWLGSWVGESEKTLQFIEFYQEKIEHAKKSTLSFSKRPKVYIEEWDEPTIIGIKWFTELVEICGGEVLFKEKSLTTSKAIDRTVTHQEIVDANPELILICWCGKKFDRESFEARGGFKEIEALKNNKLFELDPAIFLQPGPALFKDGIDILLRILKN